MFHHCLRVSCCTLIVGTLASFVDPHKCDETAIFLYKNSFFKGDPLGICLFSHEQCITLPEGWTNNIASAQVIHPDACYLLFVHDACHGARMRIDYWTKPEYGYDFAESKSAREHQSLRMCTPEERSERRDWQLIFSLLMR